MKHKFKDYQPCEIITIFGPYIEGTFEAMIITTLFDNDVAVENLIIYLN